MAGPIPFKEPTTLPEPWVVFKAFEKLRELPMDTDNIPSIRKFDADATASISQWRSKLQMLEKMSKALWCHLLGKCPV